MVWPYLLNHHQFGLLIMAVDLQGEIKIRLRIFIAFLFSTSLCANMMLLHNIITGIIWRQQVHI
jgi:hypothetical protein